MPNYWFDHIHLLSPDSEETARFYEKTFGARQIGRLGLDDGRFVLKLSLNGSTILVSQGAGDNPRTGLDHFGIRADNLDEAVDELKASGIKFTKEITEIRQGLRVSFLKTPDDVSIELVEGSIPTS